MSSQDQSATATRVTDDAVDPLEAARRKRRLAMALTVIVTCQMMLVVDASIVNIALPKIQASLHFSTANLAWVFSAYSLAFGSLLLLGGRAGDAFGRLRMFIGGLVVFTLASLMAGLAPDSGVMIAARVLQGVGGAFAAPASLALLATTFSEPAERRRALGVFSMIAGLGLTIGLILGGLLTTVSWRWVFIVNIPFGIATIALARPYLKETERHPVRFDVVGAITSTLGLTGVVYGFIRAASDGWSDAGTMISFVVGVAVLLVFGIIETRVEHPLMSLRLLTDRVRGGAYLNMLLMSCTMGASFFFLSILLQDVLGFSPLRAGLAFLPMAVVQYTCARMAPKLVGRIGPQIVTATGSAVGLGMAVWVTMFSGSSTYASGAVGPFILIGIGIGLAFMPLNMLILAGLPPRDTGSASGLLQCLQQIGVSLGVAVLTTVYTTSLRNSLTHPAAGLAPSVQLHDAMAHGVATAFYIVVVFLGVAFLSALLLLRPRKPAPAA
jgi:EmrB/QacA subfamily drug resistance transporter